MRVVNRHAHLRGPEEVEEKRGLWDSLGYVKICMSFRNEEALEVPGDAQERLYYGNAAEWLGLEG